MNEEVVVRLESILLILIQTATADMTKPYIGTETTPKKVVVDELQALIKILSEET